MEVSGVWQVFSLGCLGGCFLELLRWWQLREADFPSYAKRPMYWIITISMILAGGILSVLYGTDNVTALLPMNIGASAPALIAAFTPPSRQDQAINSGDEFLGKKDFISTKNNLPELSYQDRLKIFLRFNR